MFNSNNDSSIRVRAEGNGQSPNFRLEENDGLVLLKDREMPVVNALQDDDKVCSVEPNFTSYQIYIPKNRILYISVMEGNFYTEHFDGDLNLKIEDGIVKLKDMHEPVKVMLNAGSVFVNDIQNTSIDAETNLGVLVHNMAEETSGQPKRQLRDTFGNPDNSIVIRAIMANIYLYGVKD